MDSNNIIIGFSRPKGGFIPFSWLIKWGEETDYSHVYLRFYSKSYDRWLVYQASGSKVNFIGWEKFQEEEIIVREFSVSINPESQQKMVQYCIDSIGLPYSLKGVLGIGIVLLYRKFGKNIKNPFNEGPNNLWCSKAVEYLLPFFNMNLDVDPNLVMPKDVYEYLEKIENGKNNI